MNYYIKHSVHDETDFDYHVYDTAGTKVKSFRSYEEALRYIVRLRDIYMGIA
jgi:hypothetical protein